MSDRALIQPGDGAPSPYDDPLGYNPFLPDVHADPYPSYRRLRESSPVHHPFPGMWILARHRHIAPLLRDPRLGSDRRKSTLYDMFIQTFPDAERFNAIPPSMLFLDPPDHTRMRRLVNKAFTPKVVEGMRPTIEAIVSGLLDEVQERRSMDVIADLAYPLPVAVICDLLAIPHADRERVRSWSLDLIYTLDPIVPQDRIDRALAASEEFRGYVRDLIRERRARPGEDLLSRLVAAEDSGSRLSDEDIISTCVLLLVAGHETTSGLIGNGLLALLRHPDQLRRLQDDATLIRSAVEELLRYDGPVQLTARVALQDVEVDGHRIERGEDLVFLSGSANRDPEVFDDPDGLDIGRRENHHVAFGGGVHFCLGAPLARLEAAVAIGEVARRFPRIALATADVEWRDTVTLRALRALPVTL